MIGIHSPPNRKFVILFQLRPASLFYHKLPSNLRPSLLPINSCIEYLDSDFIDSSIVSYEAKPTVSHSSKFVFILNEAIIIKFIFIERSLLIKGDWIGGSQLLNWYHRLFNFFDFDVSFNMSFKSIEKETIRTFIYFCYFNIFWLLY